jgi:DNA polymerase I-like protein with 3'-5' exonuclease and polymerase domains
MPAELIDMLLKAQHAGTGFRLYGCGVQVTGASRLPADISCALQIRCDELWEHLGGVTLDQPPLELLAALGVTVVIPETVDEARAVLTAIETDSSINTPGELLYRPPLIGLDIETAALPGTEQRPSVKLRKDGQPAKRQPKFNSVAALDPQRSRVRTVQLYGGGRRCLVLDTDKVPLDTVAPVLQRRTAIIHNATFELRHLAAAGIAVPHFEDTMQAAGLLLGVYRRGLDDAASAYLDIELPKGLQRSDWSAPQLSRGQYAYAALDAIVAFRLWLKLRQELLAKDRGGAYLLQRDVTPAVVRMITRGILIDRQRHSEQVAEWSAALAKARREFSDAAQRKSPDTPNEVRAYLQEVLPDTLLASWPRTARGLLSIRAAELRRVAHLPAIRSLLSITAAEKLISVFGTELVTKLSSKSGRLHSSYQIASAKTGRFASNNPNMQQIPKNRAPRFRQCVIAAPGMVLIIGDFNMMELRAAAAVSNDPLMTEDFANGVDLHRQQAAAMLNIPYAEVDATARDRAKPVNFSMLYGAGAAGIVATAWNNYEIELSLAEAEAARQGFLRRYSTYAEWMPRNHTRSNQRGMIVIGRLGRVIEAAWEAKAKGKRFGGIRWDDDEDHEADDEAAISDDFFYTNSGWTQDALKYTLCCNAPIQGACADASMLALIKVDAALREAGIAGGPVLFVHDEIVLEIGHEDGAAASRILTEGMTAAFAETFPGAPLDDVVSVHIGDSWGSKT